MSLGKKLLFSAALLLPTGAAIHATHGKNQALAEKNEVEARLKASIDEKDTCLKALTGVKPLLIKTQALVDKMKVEKLYNTYDPPCTGADELKLKADLIWLKDNLTKVIEGTPGLPEDFEQSVLGVLNAEAIRYSCSEVIATDTRSGTDYKLGATTFNAANLETGLPAFTRLYPEIWKDGNECQRRGRVAHEAAHASGFLHKDSEERMDYISNFGQTAKKVCIYLGK